MPEKKKSSSRIQIIFSAMLLGLIFMVQLYCMINLPDQIVVIGLLSVLLLLVLYVLLRNIIAEFCIWKDQREEEHENLLKASKASYLMMKKYFEEIEDTLEYLEKEAKIPTNEIVGTQKGIGKAIINRSRENADAIISSNDQLTERVEEISRMVEGNREQVIESYRSLNESSLQQIELKQQDIILNLKDMELRLNNAIMQSQKVVTVAAPAMSAPVVQPEVTAQAEPAAQTKTPSAAAEAESEREAALGAEILGESALAEESAAAPEAAAELEPESAAAPGVEPEPELTATLEIEPEPELTADLEIEPEPESTAIPEVESVPESAAAPESVAEPEPDSAASEVKPEPEPAAAPEEKPPMPDLSDPNKKMSADDIAALFAAMT